MERVVVVIVILVALALAGFALFGPKHNPGASAQKEVQFTLTEYKITLTPSNPGTPNRVTIESGRVKLVFSNQGKNSHQIEIYDTVEQRVIAKIDFLRPKGSTTLWLDLVGGRRYQVYDPIWRKRGMEALIITK